MTLTESRETPTNALHAETDESAVEKKIFLTVLIALLMWGTSVFFWGIPGLYMPALAAVPVLYGVLIWIARG
jgi:hypothetical protein